MSIQCFYVNISMNPSESEFESSVVLTCKDFERTLNFSKETNCDLWFQRTCSIDNTIFEDDNDRFVCKRAGGDENLEKCVEKWFETVTNVRFGSDLFSLTSAGNGKNVMHFYFNTDGERDAYTAKHMKLYCKKDDSL